jgi:twitching motility protein PilI
VSTPNPQDPILVLYELERRSRGHAFGLPEQEEAKEAWHGIGFRLGEVNFVAPLGQVSEILVSPAVSRVPGAKKWVAGIANVRGTLLPVLDLRGFLNQGASQGRRRRTLVVEHGPISAALVVDDVMGLKHFFDEERTSTLPPLPSNVLAYVSGAFEQGGQLWVVFDMHRLVLDPEFMQVAA